MEEYRERMISTDVHYVQTSKINVAGNLVRTGVPAQINKILSIKTLVEEHGEDLYLRYTIKDGKMTAEIVDMYNTLVYLPKERPVNRKTAIEMSFKGREVATKSARELLKILPNHTLQELEEMIYDLYDKKLLIEDYTREKKLEEELHEREI